MNKAEPIAIIGIGCRFPGGANTPDLFWKLLIEGRDAICPIPNNRWNDFNREELLKKIANGGFLTTEIDQFDAGFFHISAREAKFMDPQQRLLLEVAWEALEGAAIAPDQLRGSQTGVFIGICTHDYLRMLDKTNNPAALTAYMSTGNSSGVASGRLSYVFGFQGPSLSIDTAHSSSLVAVHTACQSLQSGECSLALAGGVNLLLSPEESIEFANANMLSPEGRCKTFDESANGYVRGEGCGIIVLKPLSLALQEGDHILAVIESSGINQDGASSGLTVPNGAAQEALLHTVLEKSHCDSEQIDYVEAHGTGTQLGDPTEMGTIGTVYGGSHSQLKPLLVGSVKTNIGHLEAAAGIAGLIKVVLALQNRVIPAHLNLKKLNSNINLKKINVQIPQEKTPWTSNRRRVAAVSSFGYSGTNAHVIISEAPEAQIKSKTESFERPLHLLTLSALDEKALKALQASYLAYANAHAKESLADVAYTANTGRMHFPYRSFVIGKNMRELADKLKRGKEKTFSQEIGKTMAFLFFGQGYRGMAKRLYETHPLFRNILDQCAEISKPLLDGYSLLDFLCANPLENQKVDEQFYVEPALFSFQYALFHLWKSWGITPHYVMGHDLGDYVAATVCGILSLEDGLKLIISLAKLIRSIPTKWKIDPLLAEYYKIAQTVSYREPQIDMISNLTGQKVEKNTINADYWIQNLRQETSFHTGIQALKAKGCHLFLEISVHPVILETEMESVSSGHDLWLPSLRHNVEPWETMLDSLGAMYCQGIAIDWKGFDASYSRQKVALPTYPFQRSRYWAEAIDQYVAQVAQRSIAPGAAQEPIQQKGRRSGGIYPYMGMKLYEENSLFREAIEACAKIIGNAEDIPFPLILCEAGYAHLSKQGSLKVGKTKATVERAKEIGISSPPQESLRVALIKIIAKILGCQPEEIKEDRSLISLGIDSMMGMELRSKIYQNFNLQLPVTFFLGDTSLSHLLSDLEKLLDQQLSSKTETAEGVKEIEISSPPQEPLRVALIKIIAKILGCQPEEIKEERSLISLGIDSIMGMELRSKIYQNFNLQLPVTFFLGDTSLSHLLSDLEKLLDQQLSSKAEQEKQPEALSDEMMEVVEKEPREERSSLPTTLSFGQKRLLFLHDLSPENPHYNIGIALQLKGDLDVEAFNKACQAIIKRHDILRLIFPQRQNQSHPIILSPLIVPVPLIYLEPEADLDIEQLFNQEIEKIFNFEKGPLLRFCLLEFSKQDHIFFITMHHIISDGRSFNIFVKELKLLYEAFSLGKPSPLPPLTYQYQDYVNWQVSYLNDKKIQELSHYWEKTLSNVSPVLELPFDKPRTDAPPVIEEQRCLLSKELFDSLKKLGEKCHATLHTILMAAFEVLLYRYSGQLSFAIGITSAGRTELEHENLIGFFTNTIPIKVELTPDLSFENLLKEVAKWVREACEHEQFPLEKLFSKLSITRERNREPLFQVVFNFVSYNYEGELSSQDLSVQHLWTESGRAVYDLFLNVLSINGKIHAAFRYNSCLFSPEKIARLAEHFVVLLENLVQTPDIAINRVPILSQSEMNRMVFEWNKMKDVPFSKKLLHQLFEERAAHRPDSCAIVYENTEMTYGELNAQANRLAHFLKKKEVKAETIVAVSLNKSPLLMIALLGILKAGGAFLPIDPNYPEERLKYLLEDSRGSFLITESSLTPKFSFFSPYIAIDQIDLSKESTENLSLPYQTTDLAYIIYTSGSTGKPKGTMIEQRNLTYFAQAFSQACHIDSSSRVLQFASISFDATIAEWPCAFSQGAALCMIPSNQVMGRDFIDLCNDLRVTYAVIPPILLSSLPLDGVFTSMQTVVSAGDVCPERVYQHWCEKKQFRFMNGYGPTETTVSASIVLCHVNQSNRVIGRPLPRTVMHILDTALNPVPVGVEGEICIGGEGVGRGYLRREALTGEKFIKNPFGDREEAPILYKSGDLGKYLPDGQIEIVGRIDFQVKLRGFRIELGEIENELLKFDSVKQVTVIVFEESPSHKSLVAYVVDETMKGTGEEDLISRRSLEFKKRLSNVLPEYMVPTTFVFLETLPLNQSGKVDKKRLPQPSVIRISHTTFKEAKSEVERQIVAIWSKVLRLEKVGLHDNFFDLGGNSLLMSEMYVQLKQMKSLDIDREALANLKLVDLYKYTTVELIVNYLSDKNKTKISLDHIKKRMEKKKELLKSKKRV